MGILFCCSAVGATVVTTWALEVVHLPCHTEARTRLQETCAYVLPEKGQRVQRDMNPLLWLVCPTWLLWASVAGYYCAIRQPTLGNAELPIACGCYFAYGVMFFRLEKKLIHRSRAAPGWLRRTARAGKLIGFPLDRCELRKFTLGS
jgi:hypothetical protein